MSRLEEVATSWARRVRKQPLIDAMNMKRVIAVWEEPYLVPIREL